MRTGATSQAPRRQTILAASLWPRRCPLLATAEPATRRLVQSRLLVADLHRPRLTTPPACSRLANRLSDRRRLIPQRLANTTRSFRRYSATLVRCHVLATN